MRIEQGYILMELHLWGIANAWKGNAKTPDFFLSVEVHEYVHHLQFSGFVSAKLKELLPVWTEGFATYIQYEYEISVFRPGWYGPLGSYHLGWEYIEVALVRPSVRLNDLPSLTAFLDWQDITAALSGYTPAEIIYYWGAWFFRFLVEVHPTELVGLKEVLEGGGEADARIHDFMARLNDDWYDWDKTLATLSVADAPEPIIVGKEGGVEIYLDQLFRTINELTFEVSTIVGLSTNDNPWYYDTPPNVAVAGRRATIIPNSLGTWMFTITATNVDGESAQLPFTVVVERGLELTDLIVIRDPLSTTEGRTVVNLNHYFDSVERIAFTAESTNTEVAIVEVTMEGRLIVAPISPGTAQITVRATSGELRHEHTFTIRNGRVLALAVQGTSSPAGAKQFRCSGAGMNSAGTAVPDNRLVKVSGGALDQAHRLDVSVCLNEQPPFAPAVAEPSVEVACAGLQLLRRD